MASRAWLPGADAAVVAAHDDAVVGAVDRDGPRALEEVDPPAEELVLQRRRDLRVLLGEHLVAGDDQGHLAAQRREHVDELHAGHARPDDDEVLRPGRGRIGVPSGQHPLAVDVGPVGEPGTAARAEEDGVGVELHVAVRRVDHHAVGAGQPPASPHEADALAVEQLPRGPLELALDGLDARAEGGRLDRRRRRAVRPISGERPIAARAPPVAIMALDGMQSRRWAAPPITSCSTIVTSAPSRAA